MRLSNKITAVDAHACGEPGRVITGGVSDVPGNTMLEKKAYLQRHADGLRKLMLREPRGYPAMCCNVILPPTNPEADAGFVIMEQTEYPAMSGTNTIVTFENVPAFATHLDAVVEVPTLGSVSVDVAWGGMFYVIADAEELNLRLVPDEGREIATHPEAHRQNAVVVSTGTGDWDKPHTWGGALDRSPCGTGTCAKMAVLHAKGQLGLEEDFCHESILGTLFTGRLLRETKVGDYDAVVPTLSGRAWITGFADYVIDAEDPFPEGFTVGDIWGRVS